jgi:hypothetical protein
MILIKSVDERERELRGRSSSKSGKAAWLTGRGESFDWVRLRLHLKPWMVARHNGLRLNEARHDILVAMAYGSCHWLVSLSVASIFPVNIPAVSGPTLPG